MKMTYLTKTIFASVQKARLSASTFGHIAHVRDLLEGLPALRMDCRTGEHCQLPGDDFAAASIPSHA